MYGQIQSSLTRASHWRGEASPYGEFSLEFTDQIRERLIKCWNEADAFEVADCQR